MSPAVTEITEMSGSHPEATVVKKRLYIWVVTIIIVLSETTQKRREIG